MPGTLALKGNFWSLWKLKLNGGNDHEDSYHWFYVVSWLFPCILKLIREMGWLGWGNSEGQTEPFPPSHLAPLLERRLRTREKHLQMSLHSWPGSRVENWAWRDNGSCGLVPSKAGQSTRWDEDGSVFHVVLSSTLTCLSSLSMTSCSLWWLFWCRGSPVHSCFTSTPPPLYCTAHFSTFRDFKGRVAKAEIPISQARRLLLIWSSVALQLQAHLSASHLISYQPLRVSLMMSLGLPISDPHLDSSNAFSTNLSDSWPPLSPFHALLLPNCPSLRLNHGIPLIENHLLWPQLVQWIKSVFFTCTLLEFWEGAPIFLPALIFSHLLHSRLFRSSCFPRGPFLLDLINLLKFYSTGPR